MTQFKLLFFVLFLLTSSLSFGQSGSYFKGPALVEGFATITTAAGTTTLTKDSQTKQIFTGSSTQTVVLPDATTIPLGRRFFLINKSSGTVTVNASGGGLLGTVTGGSQVEIHLRAAGSAAGTWDYLSYSSGGGTWGSITGTLSAQTDLNTALGLKANSASPTFTGTVTTPVTASRALVTGASSELSASATTATQVGYLSTTTGDVQVALDAKQARSTLTTKGDLYVATASATTARQGVGSNGETILADSDMTNGIRYGTPVGTDNYIKANPSFEGNAVTGWATYADAAGTSPVDCTGGSPNSTFAINSSAPILNGSYQGLATLSTGATRQGEGFSYAFSIPTKYSASPGVHQIEFDYAISGGTFVAGSDSDRTSAGDSTFTVWVYDVTNSQLIQPSTYRLYSTTGGKFVANFQNNSGSTSYRLCVHKGTSATVSGSNITVKFDDFRTFPAQYAYGTPITDWVSYTPTGSWVSNTTYTGRWRRVGDSMESFIYITTSGAPTAATLTVNFLPSGLSVDTAKFNGANNVGYGYANILDSGTRVYVGSVGYFSSTTVSVTHSESGNNGTVDATNPMTWATGDSVTLNIKVPITGWSSSTQVSDGYDGRLIAARYTQTAGTQSFTSGVETVVGFENKTYDTVNAQSGSTTSWRWTCPSFGFYRVNASVQFTGGTWSQGESVLISVFKNGSLWSTINRNYAISTTAGTTNLGTNGAVTVQCNAGDYITVVAYQDSGASLNLSTDGRYNWVEIEKLQSPQTMSATEVVAARYTTNAALSVPNSGTFTIIDFEDSDGIDTHGAVTTGASWKFSAPVSGLYEINPTVVFAAEAWTAGNAVNMRLYKNGSSYTNLFRWDCVATATQLPYLTGSALISLNAGDYIDVRLSSNRTGGAATLINDNTFNHINIKRIK